MVRVVQQYDDFCVDRPHPGHVMEIWNGYLANFARWRDADARRSNRVKPDFARFSSLLP